MQSIGRTTVRSSSQNSLSVSSSSKSATLRKVGLRHSHASVLYHRHFSTPKLSRQNTYACILLCSATSVVSDTADKDVAENTSAGKLTVSDWSTPMARPDIPSGIMLQGVVIIVSYGPKNNILQHLLEFAVCIDECVVFCVW